MLCLRVSLATCSVMGSAGKTGYLLALSDPDPSFSPFVGGSWKQEVEGPHRKWGKEKGLPAWAGWGARQGGEGDSECPACTRLCSLTLRG